MRATDPDPGDIQRAKDERAAVAARRHKRAQPGMGPSVQSQRARIEATTGLRQHLATVQDAYLEKIDNAGDGDLANLADDLERSLHEVCVWLSHDLDSRFRVVGELQLAQVFPQDEMEDVLRQLDARLRHVLQSKPPRPPAVAHLRIVDERSAERWLRTVFAETRAVLSAEIMHRFADLRDAVTLTADEAIERRLRQLDAYINRCH